MRVGRYNFAALTLAALTLALPILASGEPTTAPAIGTIARQLKLKMELSRNTHGLAVSLAHNRTEWQRLAPDAQERYRREAYAFLQKNPKQQQELLDRFGQFMDMSPQRQQAYALRAKWLNVVVASFSPQERAEMEQMPPQQRASILIDRRSLLTQQGKLPDAEQPTSATSSK
jgi:hypothetical protein